ncbi:MAG: AEC family transporter [Sphingomonas sp.]
MLSILAITLPVFLLIGAGFAAGKAGAFGAEHARALGRFVLNVALPALIFQSLATRHWQEIVQPGFLAVYALASLAAFGAAFAWFRLAAKADAPRSAIRALGASFSNSGFVGLPIALQLLGPAAAVPVGDGRCSSRI